MEMIPVKPKEKVQWEANKCKNNDVTMDGGDCKCWEAYLGEIKRIMNALSLFEENMRADLGKEEISSMAADATYYE